MVDIEKCCLTHYPAPLLGQAAMPIDEINADIRRLAEKMIDVMISTKGVGLAGPQIGVNLRIFVFTIDGTRENARVYINPEITVSGPLEANNEGCLSLPGVEASIKRFAKCTITATDLDGNRFTEQAQGLQVRGFQHEFDHLEGILIKERMSYAAKIAARRKLKQLQRDFEENKS